MFRLLSIALILFALLPVPAKGASSPTDKETKNVLILYSLDKWNPSHNLTEQLIGKSLLTTGRTS